MLFSNPHWSVTTTTNMSSLCYDELPYNHFGLTSTSFTAAMYNNYGNPPGMQMPPQNSQPGQFDNPLYGASSGLIRSGIGVYGEKFLGSSSEFMQSNVRNLQQTFYFIYVAPILTELLIQFLQINRYFSNPQYYFHVNDQYVRNKLKVILFPFFHRVSYVS